MKRRKGVWIAAFIIAMLAGVLCLLGRDGFTYTPFATVYTVDAPSGAFFGQDGAVYAIDGGKKHVVRIDANEELSLSLWDDDYASLVCDDEAGNVYMATVTYMGVGTLVGREKIFRMNADGGERTLLYEVAYEASDRVMQYGNLLSMFARDGELVFSLREGETLRVYTLSLDTGETAEKTYAFGAPLAAASVDPESRLPVVVTRDSRLLRVNAAGTVETIPTGSANPWRVCAAGDYIYFTDLLDRSVKVWHASEMTTVMRCAFYAYTVDVWNGRVMTTDYATLLFADGGEIAQAKLPRASLYAVAWIALSVLAIFTLALLARLIMWMVTRLRGEVFTRALLVISSVLLVSVLVTYLVLSETSTRTRTQMTDSLMLLGDIMVSQTDVNALNDIHGTKDTSGDAYGKLRAPLDDIIDAAYENDLYYYYAIYVGDGQTVYSIVDYEDTVPAYYPAYAYEDSGYDSVLDEGAVIVVDSEISAYGAWSYVIRPICDASGSPIAIMEIGVSMDQQNEEQQALVQNVALTVASAVIVIVMMVVELLFFVSFMARRKIDGSAISQRFPLRTLVFLAYFADSVQDGFIAVLAARLYTAIPFLPDGVGAALPITSQLLFCALAALAANAFCSRLGVRGSLTLGFMLQMAGFGLCAIQLSYVRLLIGKSLAGFGLGLILVTANTIAAMDDDEHSTDAFSSINAGMVGGCTAGVGVGSILLTITSYQVVFASAALCALLALLQTLSLSNERQIRQKKEEKRGMWRFLTQRSAIAFLALILLPCMVMVNFREYYFPVFAESHGLSEVWISRIFMLTGVAIIYTGPALTRALMRWLGDRRTVILASLLMCGAIIQFACLPSVATSLVAVTVLSLTLVFAYNAQSSYYASLPAVGVFGEARAMSVYSLFDSAGQTTGPLLFGLAMTARGQTGVFAIGAVMGVLALLFVLSSRKKAS